MVNFIYHSYLCAYMQKVVGCFIENDGKFIILHRIPGDMQGDKWGLPAGGVKEDETEETAMIREIKEETGLNVDKEDLEFLGKWEWIFPIIEVEFFAFKLKLDNKVDVKLRPEEHIEYKWVSPRGCYSRKDLVHGFHELLELTKYVLLK